MKKHKDILYSLRRYDNLDGNFTQFSNDIFKMTTGNEFKVYCYLCSVYNRGMGYSYPSLSTIANHTNMSISTVQRSISSLEKLGLIKVFKFDNQTSQHINNIYRVYYPIIIKDEIEEGRRRKEREEIEKALEELDNNTEGKIHIYQREIEDED
jgi:predicted transcriptional regulator